MHVTKFDIKWLLKYVLYAVEYESVRAVTHYEGFILFSNSVATFRP
jgi:hypothetical protein